MIPYRSNLILSSHDEIEEGDSSNIPMQAARGKSVRGPKDEMGVDLAPRRAERAGGFSVIRQAISCDICGSEKKQTNHWFVAYEQGGELRVGGWSSRNRMRPGSKHLCGQTCLHKLVDEFMAKAISMKAQRTSGEEAVEVSAAMDTRPTDTSLTSNSAYTAVESPHRVELPSPVNAVSRPQAELVRMPGRPQVEPAVPLDEIPAYSTRSWQAEAWERERERELNAAERRPDILARRRSRA